MTAQNSVTARLGAAPGPWDTLPRPHVLKFPCPLFPLSPPAAGPGPAGLCRSIPRPATAVSASLCRQRGTRRSPLPLPGSSSSGMPSAPGQHSCCPLPARPAAPLRPLRPASRETRHFVPTQVPAARCVALSLSLRHRLQGLISSGLASPLLRSAEQLPGTHRPGCPTSHVDPLRGAVGAHLSIPRSLRPCAVWTCHRAHLTRLLASLPSVFIKVNPCRREGPNRFGQVRSSFHKAKAMCVRIPTHSDFIN